MYRRVDQTFVRAWMIVLRMSRSMLPTYGQRSIAVAGTMLKGLAVERGRCAARRSAGLARHLHGQDAAGNDDDTQDVGPAKPFAQQGGGNRHAEERVEKVERGRLDRADAPDQHEPDPCGQNAGDKRRVGKGAQKARGPVHGELLEHERGDGKDRRADEHLEPDDHHDIPARRGPAHRQRGRRQRKRRDETQRKAHDIDPARQTRAHDHGNADHPREQAGQAERAQPFVEQQPAEEGHHQWHGRCDDRGKRRLDPLHRDEVESEVNGVLAQPEHERRAPLCAGQPAGLPKRQGDADADHAGNEEPDGQ